MPPDCIVMRLVWVVPLCLVSGLLFNTDAGFAEARKGAQNHVQLVSDSKSNVNDRKANIKLTQPESKRSEQEGRELPSIKDLGLSLDSTEVAKRNELDSVIVQPWAPGRGAVGVKLEVTW